jgi:hypothetical protein
MKIKLNEKWLIPIFILIAVLRYPPNLIDANLFAEDGTVFLTDYRSSGLASFNNLFNGYPVFGLYFLTGVASWMHAITGLAGYMLPTFIALTSFIYWGLFAYSPIYFFKGVMARANSIIFAFAILLMPLGTSDAVILGTIGNLKFSFFPLSFFVASHLAKKESMSNREFSANAVLLVVCILTNPLSILSLYVLIQKLLKSISTHDWFQLIWFGIFLTFASYPVLAQFNNSYKITGYLDAPFQFEKTIEIFAGQTILYAPLHSIYTQLNDFFALMIALLLAIFVLRQSRQMNFLPVVALVMALFGSFVFVLQRPGVSAYFSGYTLTGPSQFFYAQNVLVVTALFLSIEGLSRQKGRVGIKQLRLYIALTLFASQIFPTTPIGSFGKGAPMQSQVSSAIESASEVCSTNLPEVNIPIYPTGMLIFRTEREFWC